MNTPEANDDKYKSGDNGTPDEKIPGPASTLSPGGAPTTTPESTEKPYNEADGVGYWLVVDGQAVELLNLIKTTLIFMPKFLMNAMKNLG